MKLVLLNPKDGIGDAERELIGVACHVEDAVPVSEVIEQAMNHKCQIWVLYEEEEAKGILVTQAYVKTSELFLWLFSGKDVVLHLKPCLDIISSFAKEHGLSKLTSLSTQLMALVLEKRHGFKRKWIAMEKEI